MSEAVSRTPAISGKPVAVKTPSAASKRCRFELGESDAYGLYDLPVANNGIEKHFDCAAHLYISGAECRVPLGNINASG